MAEPKRSTGVEGGAVGRGLADLVLNLQGSLDVAPMPK